MLNLMWYGNLETPVSSNHSQIPQELLPVCDRPTAAASIAVFCHDTVVVRTSARADQEAAFEVAKIMSGRSLTSECCGNRS